MEGRDLAEVAALSARCFSHGAWTEAELGAELARDFAEVWVAVEPTGAVLGYAVAWFVGDDAELLTIGTDPSARRRGVARALVQRLCESTVARQVRSLTLEVRRDNEAACRLYEGAGFVEVASRRAYYSDGEDARIMSWYPSRAATPAPT